MAILGVAPSLELLNIPSLSLTASQAFWLFLRWSPPDFYAGVSNFMTYLFLSVIDTSPVISYSLFLQVHNVNFAFELMQDAGLAKPKARPEGINLVSYALQHFMSEGGGLRSIIIFIFLITLIYFIMTCFMAKWNLFVFNKYKIFQFNRILFSD